MKGKQIKWWTVPQHNEFFIVNVLSFSVSSFLVSEILSVNLILLLLLKPFRVSAKNNPRLATPITGRRNKKREEINEDE